MSKMILALALGWFLSWRIDDVYQAAVRNRGRVRTAVSLQNGELRVNLGQQDWRQVADRLLDSVFPEERP